MFENTSPERTERCISRSAVALSITLQYMGGPVRRSRLGIFGGPQGTRATSNATANGCGLSTAEPHYRRISGKDSTPSSPARNGCPLIAAPSGRGRWRGRPQTRILHRCTAISLAAFAWLFAWVPFATGQAGDTEDSATPTSVQRPDQTRIQQKIGSHLNAIQDTCSVSGGLSERFHYFVDELRKLNEFIEELLRNGNVDLKTDLYLMFIDSVTSEVIPQIDQDDIMSLSLVEIQEKSRQIRRNFDRNYRLLYNLSYSEDYFDEWAITIAKGMECLQ